MYINEWTLQQNAAPSHTALIQALFAYLHRVNVAWHAVASSPVDWQTSRKSKSTMATY